MNRKQVRGFTLVEILIVVIILGILAAIVIPQFTNASQDARVSSLQSLTQTLRSQIELYKLQHGDTLPDVITNWNPLTQVTQYPLPVGPTTKNYGPYMQSPPVNPLNSQGGVADAGLASNSDPKPAAWANVAVGWAYDYRAGAGTGRIWGVHPTGTAAGGPMLLD